MVRGDGTVVVRGVEHFKDFDLYSHDKEMTKEFQAEKHLF